MVIDFPNTAEIEARGVSYISGSPVGCDVMQDQKCSDAAILNPGLHSEVYKKMFLEAGGTEEQFNTRISNH